MDNTIFQIQGSVSKITSMSRGTLRLQFDSMENISGDAMQRLFNLIDKPGWMSVNIHMIEATDIIDLPPVRDVDRKISPSTELRNTLWHIWKKDDGGYKDFDNYYLYTMNKLINHFKEKLT